MYLIILKIFIINFFINESQVIYNFYSCLLTKYNCNDYLCSKTKIKPPYISAISAGHSLS